MEMTLNKELEDQKKHGVLLVLTGPSGVGKDTVLDHLVKDNPSIIKIITTTTRPRREHEKEGEPYYFFSRKDFADKIGAHAFFEWVEFRGELYGTQTETLMNAITEGNDVVWRIDARGMKNIKDKIRVMIKRSVFVFLTAPIEVLRERVLHDEGENFYKRWNEETVNWEISQYADCDYLIENREGQLEKTIVDVLSVVRAKRLEIIAK